ncbi:LysR family transcriptional regulator [Sphaerotilus hippei]|uniref:LysR family transcriptional regulator n=1 Tax=Sphaerotilus hippei TaxID=744406 RepID=A0A318GYK6_9BURK|nr:LysR substrate-binding domain-containing protein [Sphaerotilus hippei]PXW95202.1 LysR family transcriptional regulator [Sphaerotilus hippei]
MSNPSPSNDDLRVFATVVLRSGFAAAAQDLGVSPAYVSKRVRVLEARLGARLLHRTTRQVTLTEDGERAYRWAQRILDDVDQLLQEIGGTREQPRGTLRVSSSFGFGRGQVAPALSALTERHPRLQVRLELFDRLVDVAAEGFDLDVRVGDEIAPHLIARRLADNHRVLCAAPGYVAQRGAPRTLDDLRSHDCLAIKERDHPFGVWRLQCDGREQTVKVSGPLSSNNGEVALRWALDGRGIVLRSVWQVAPLLADGRLVQVLPGCLQPANVWAVYPVRLERSAKLRVAVEFLVQWFEAAQALHGGSPKEPVEPAAPAAPAGRPAA